MKKQPADWPEDGPVDLAVHDLPHGSSTTEWWYTNGHCVAEGGRRFSYFAAFFRKVQGYHPTTREPRYAHSVAWAIHDVDGEHTQFLSRVDPSASQEGLRRLKAGMGVRDDRLNRALQGILEKGVVPKPDVVMERHAHVNLQALELDYAGDTFIKNRNGTYALKLFDKRRSVGLSIELTPRKPPIRHGHNGVVRGSEDESMFYYFIPRMDVRGTVTYNGSGFEIAQGQGWYDHEFGVGVVDDANLEAEARMPAAERTALQQERRARWDARQIGWNWISAQLEDGTDLTFYPEQYVVSGESAGEHALTIGPKGEIERWEGATFEPLEWWQSSQTFVEYPIRWKLQIPSAGIDLDVRAAFKDQEVMTLIAKSSFYEGRVEVEGTHKGKPIKGIGFVERSGLGLTEDLDGFFEQVGKLVRKSVSEVIPKAPTFKQASFLIAGPGKDHYMEGVDIEQYARAHLHPIREIVDRGGKGWRSYAMNTCVDVVGGDSRQFSEYISVPELMQTGSLIVDDVEDKSTVRRGGPAAHMIYGEAQAINSGTAAFFIGAPLLRNARLSEHQLCTMYAIYFDGLRAAHAGQALDLDGFHPLMQRAVDSAEVAALLEKRVLGVHMLKTAAPAGCLARIGAVAGGGTPEQVECLGRFFEDVGLAFQIVDDVLNLRGFKGDWKSNGEDVMQGKITLPMAVGMARLNTSGRKYLWETLKSKPQDPEVVRKFIDTLEEVGAIEACSQQARSLVENGWGRIEPVVDDSISKMMLRAFGWYVIERHY
ncbi:MAG TPA: polyprenyl synthetase family protein [Polyangiales bacterium]|nr:polyprenyl synthetase family protein [Polyangiales bacterium]